MRRRELLRGGAAAAALLGGGGVAAALSGCGHRTSVTTPPWQATTPLPVPPQLRPTRGRLDLRLQVGRHVYLPGHPTESWGVNAAVLGPTIRLRRGEQVAVAVRNDLPETSTLHWHGLRIPAAVDGGPHQPIQPGQTWRPVLPVDQPAATLWYHPHTHGATAQQVHRGIAGLLYVDDGSDEALPHRYGIDDIPMVLQDRTIAPDGSSSWQQQATFGQLGQDMCVNATLHAWCRVRTSLVRLRVLNGSNARRYHLEFADRRAFHVVAADAGLFPRPGQLTRASLGPGERLELVVPFANGETVRLRTVAGGETIDEGDHDLLEFRCDKVLQVSDPVPAALPGAVPLVPAADATTRTLALQGHDAINGAGMDMARIDMVLPRGALEVWRVTNRVYAHNFHIHGVDFTVLSRDDQPAEPWEQGRKDTVHLSPGNTVRLAVQVGGHVDATHPYMYHCHILRHEDAGMMGQFVVVPPGEVDRTPRTLPAMGHDVGQMAGQR